MTAISQSFLSGFSNLYLVTNFNSHHLSTHSFVKHRYFDDLITGKKLADVVGGVLVRAKFVSFRILHIQKLFISYIESASIKIRIQCPSKTLPRHIVGQQEEIMFK